MGFGPFWGSCFFTILVPESWVYNWAMAEFIVGPGSSLQKSLKLAQLWTQQFPLSVVCFCICLSKCVFLPKFKLSWVIAVETLGRTLGPVMNSATPRDGPNADSTYIDPTAHICAVSDPIRCPEWDTILYMTEIGSIWIDICCSANCKKLAKPHNPLVVGKI